MLIVRCAGLSGMAVYPTILRLCAKITVTVLPAFVLRVILATDMPVKTGRQKPAEAHVHSEKT